MYSKISYVYSKILIQKPCGLKETEADSYAFMLPTMVGNQSMISAIKNFLIERKLLIKKFNIHFVVPSIKVNKVMQ